MSFKKHRDYKLGTLLIRRDRYLDATDKFKHLLDIFPNALPDILIFLYQQLKEKYFNLQLRILIAELYIYKKGYTDALDELEECTTLDPEYSNTYVILGRMFRNDQLKNRIITIFETAISNQIFDSTIIDILPNHYLSEKNNSKSIHFFIVLCERFPNNCSYLKTLASLYAQIRNYEDAAKTYEKIGQTFNEHHEEIADRCEKLIRFCPENKTIRKILINLHIKAMNLENAFRHVDYLVERDNTFYAQANKLYKELLKLSPKTLFILKGFAKLLIKEHDFSQAINLLADVISIDHNESEMVKEMINNVLEHEPQQLLAHELKLDIAIIQREFNYAISIIESLIENEYINDIPILQKCDLIIEKHEAFQQHCIYLKSLYYFKTNQIENCIQLTQSITKKDWAEKKALLQAQALEKKGQFKEAKIRLSALLKTDPNNPTIHHALQQTYLGLLNQLVTRQESSEKESDFFKAGLVYLRKGNFIDAIEQFQKIGSDKSLLFQANTLIYRCFFEMGRFDLALNHINRSIENCDTFSDTITKNKLLYINAIIYIHSGKFELARDTLEKLYTADIKFPNIEKLLTFIRKQNHYEDHLFLSYYLSDSGEETPIAMPLSTYIKPPSFSFGHQHNKKGIEFIFKQQLLAAEEEFKLAIQLDPSLPCVYGNLLIVYLMKNQIEEAKETLKKLEHHSEINEAVLIYRGLIKLKENDEIKALDIFKNCIQKFPQCNLAHLYLGNIYWKKLNIEQAFYHQEKANQLGLYFHIINRKKHYLKDKPFTFSYWISDFYKTVVNEKTESNIQDNIKNNDQESTTSQTEPEKTTPINQENLYQTSLLTDYEEENNNKAEEVHAWRIDH